ncbi:MAG TPA: hypothetical protein VN224_15180, partial [Xanthomonadales bacterium]|nr:hypothetical protein [Xanthomonadales bacterium]
MFASHASRAIVDEDDERKSGRYDRKPVDRLFEPGDHVGGFAPIVRALRVDAIADSGQTYAGRAFNDGMREAVLHHVPVHVARCGDRWATNDGVAFSVLSPCGALFADGKNDVNENSVVGVLALR